MTAHRLLSAVSVKRVALLLIGVLAAFGGAASAKDDSARPVVALAVSNDGSTLFKAYADKLYRHANASAEWKQMPLPSAAAKHHITSIATAAKRNDVLYLAGRGLGVWRSDNGGRRWEAHNDGLPNRDVIALTTHADRPDTVYVVLAGKGIFRSEDAGTHWKQMDAGPRAPIKEFVHSNMPGSMQSGWLFAATPAGVARSMDCFCGWYDAGGLNATIYAVAYDPKQPQWVYAATEKGLFLSQNGGEEWTLVKSPASVVTALVVTSSGVLYAASGAHLFRSTDGAQTWAPADA